MCQNQRKLAKQHLEEAIRQIDKASCYIKEFSDYNCRDANYRNTLMDIVRDISTIKVEIL